MGWERFEEIMGILKVRSPIQKDIVRILHDLAGYSKRQDLLESELFGLGHSDSGVHKNLNRLVSLGLLEIRKAQEGPRYALSKHVWDQELKIIDATGKLASIAGRERRADTKSPTIVREVRRKLVERIGNRATSKFCSTVVRCVLAASLEWELENGQVVRRNATPRQQPPSAEGRRGRASIEAIENSTETSELSTPSGKLRETVPSNIEFVSQELTSLSAFLEEQLSDLGMRVESREGICMLKADLPLGRRQHVYLTVRRDPMMRRVFWLYTICGNLSKCTASLKDILLNHNNDCGPVRLSVLKINEEDYLACCATVAADLGWENELSQTACLISNFGDQIEERYWQKDEF